jgi:hypothetical protein
LGIIERIGIVIGGLLVLTLGGVLLWRYLGPPMLLEDPWDVDIGENIPQGFHFVAQNFGMYELINIEQNVSAQWVPVTVTPIRANVWGFAEHRTPATRAPNLPGIIEYRAVGLESGKMAYSQVSVVDPFP